MEHSDHAVIVSNRDNSGGIPENKLPKEFDPTTKERGSDASGATRGGPRFRAA